MPENRRQDAAKEVIDLLMQISDLMNCQLDRPVLSICCQLIEEGINPEALAHAVKELRKGSQPVTVDADGQVAAPST